MCGVSGVLHDVEGPPPTSCCIKVCDGGKPSPFLFKLYAEVIFRNAKLEESEERFCIGGYNVNNLRYANDTTLKASSLEGMRNILRAVKHESQNMGLNMAKTKTLTTDDYDQDTFQLDGDETEVDKDFNLLGSIVKTEVTSTVEVKGRFAMAKLKMKSLDRVFKSIRTSPCQPRFS